MSKARIGGLLALCVTAWLAVTFWLPDFILSLLQHPDGSYLSALLLKHQLKNPILHTPEFYADYVPAVARRLLGAFVGIVAVVTMLATRWKKDLVAFWNYESTPLNLAVMRVVILGEVLFLSPLSGIYALPGLTPETANPIPGYGWLRAMLPPGMELVNGAVTVYYFLAAMAFAGLFTRYVMPALLVLAFWVQLGPQFVGKIIHYHHYFWGIAILALSPCADALAIDAWVARKRGVQVNPHMADRAHGRAFVWFWWLLSAVYFFPGFWKFVVGGLDWALSDNVQLKLLAKSFETGVPPAFPLYEYPWLCRIGGLATMTFEMAFPVAVIFPSLRWVFALGGLAFHEITKFTMQISFLSLEWWYVSFINWSSCLGKFTRAPRQALVPAWKSVAGAVVVGGMMVAGFLNVDTWPWAVYPTFAAIEEKFVNSIAIKVVAPDNSSQQYLLQEDPGLIRTYTDRTKLRAYMNLVMAQPDPGERAKMLLALFQFWSNDHQSPYGARVEFWHVLVPLWPLNSEPEPFKLLGVLP